MRIRCRWAAGLYKKEGIELVRTIEIYVKDKIAMKTGESYYVCGNTDYQIVFDFDDEWADQITKTARFKYNGVHYDKVFSGNICPVPKIENTYSFEVGVFAGDLSTTTAARVPAKKSILCGSEPPAPPSEDVYAQIMQTLNDTENKARDAFYGALEEAKESGEFDGPQGIQGEKGYSPSIMLEREDDGLLVTAINEDGKQSAKVYDGKGVNSVSDEEVLAALAENDLLMAMGDADGVLCDEDNNIIEW